MATIKQIATLAGVSRGTVDRVLNNRGGVNPETDKKIREIAAMVNFTPNRVGKTLAVRKKNLKLGFLLLDSVGHNPFIDQLLDGAKTKAQELQEYGVQVELHTTHIGDCNAQLSAINRMIKNGISGLAIMPENHPEIVVRLSELTKQGVPIITVNSDINGIGQLCYVGSNFHQCGATAAGLLNLLMGGQAHVGVVTGSNQVLCHKDRIAGFKKCTETRYQGLQFIATVENHDDDFESYEKTKDLLQLSTLRGLYHIQK